VLTLSAGSPAIPAFVAAHAQSRAAETSSA